MQNRENDDCEGFGKVLLAFWEGGRLIGWTHMGRRFEGFLIYSVGVVGCGS